MQTSHPSVSSTFERLHRHNVEPHVESVNHHSWLKINMHMSKGQTKHNPYLLNVTLMKFVLVRHSIHTSKTKSALRSP